MRWANERVVMDAAGRVRRVSSVMSQHPSLFARLGLAMVIGLAFIVTLVLFIPALLIGVLVLSLFLIYNRIKLVVSGTKMPGGVLDGRRNVRVIDREHDASR